MRVAVLLLFLLSVSYASLFDDARNFAGGLFSEPTGYAGATSLDDATPNTITLALSRDVLTQDFTVADVPYQVRLVTSDSEGGYVAIWLNEKTGENLYSLIKKDVSLKRDEIYKTAKGFSIELTEIKKSNLQDSSSAFNDDVTLTVLIPTKLSLPWSMYKLVSFTATKDEIKDIVKACGSHDVQIKKILYPDDSPVIFDTWDGVNEPTEDMKFGTLYQIYSGLCKDISFLPDSSSSVTLNNGNNYVASTFPIKQREVEAICGKGTLDIVTLWTTISSAWATYKTPSSMILTTFTVADKWFRYVDEIEPYKGYVINFKPKDGKSCTIKDSDVQKLTTTTTTIGMGSSTGGDSSTGLPIPIIPAMSSEIITSADSKASIPVVAGINAIGIISQGSTNHPAQLFGDVAGSCKGYLGTFDKKNVNTVKLATDTVWAGGWRESSAGRDRDTPIAEAGVMLVDATKASDLKSIDLSSVFPVIFPSTAACSLELPSSPQIEHAVLRRGTNLFTTTVSLTKGDINTLLSNCIGGSGTRLMPVRGGSDAMPFVTLDAAGKSVATDTMRPYKAYFVGLETDSSSVTTTNDGTKDRDFDTSDDDVKIRKAAQCEFYIMPSVSGSSTTYKFCQSLGCPDDKKVYFTKTV